MKIWELGILFLAAVVFSIGTTLGIIWLAATMLQKMGVL